MSAMQPTKLKIIVLLLPLAGGLVWWSWHAHAVPKTKAPQRQSHPESKLARELTPLTVMLPLTDQPPAALNDRTFAEWCDRIRTKSCLATVNWLPTLWDGVIAAQKQDKPILLWAMNGHPLACT
jgi:hypothetical protein